MSDESFPSRVISKQSGDGDQIDVGFKRSTYGRSWSALRSIVPNDQGATTLGNNVALVVNRTGSDGGERVVLVFSVNNTKVWQIHSDDAGLRWSAPTGRLDPREVSAWGEWVAGQLRRVCRFGDGGEDLGADERDAAWRSGGGGEWLHSDARCAEQHARARTERLPRRAAHLRLL